MAQNDPEIPWPQVTKFIGQLSHDLRNHLNAIELHAAFLEEIAGNEEAKDEVKRLRKSTAALSAQLQQLSRKIAPLRPSLMRYRASELVEDLQAQEESQLPEETIEWQVSLGAEELEIDPQLVLDAFAELFQNAVAQRGEGALVFSAEAGEGVIRFDLREPKKEAPAAMAEWGARPLGTLRHGHYGLGLFRARGIFEAHHGSLQAKFDPAASALVVSVTLPCAASE